MNKSTFVKNISNLLNNLEENFKAENASTGLKIFVNDTDASLHYHLSQVLLHIRGRHFDNNEEKYCININSKEAILLASMINNSIAIHAVDNVLEFPGSGRYLLTNVVTLLKRVKNPFEFSDLDLSYMLDLFSDTKKYIEGEGILIRGKLQSTKVFENLYKKIESFSDGK